ncbi:hypothetical protein BD769DRAFT_1385786 [Suillus cothurnatus]|nr:hypothetical protein BD769DRAFT_1385786 [Suillus cothurnatus]
MPSSSLQLALIALWVEKPSIPWLNPTWQSLTGIAGVPWDYDSDDNLEARAPNVKEWTVSQAKAVKEFMAHCKETPGTVGRHSHRPDDTHAEGRAIWNMWIKEQWFKTWKEGCCPYTVLARRAITDPAQLPTLSAAQVDTAVSKKLSFAMFGNDAFTSGDCIIHFCRYCTYLESSRALPVPDPEAAVCGYATESPPEDPELSCAT